MNALVAYIKSLNRASAQAAAQTAMMNHRRAKPQNHVR